MLFFDPFYLIFMIPAFILMGITSWYVRHAYNKWSQARATSGLTGHQAAQRLISTGNLYGVQVQGTAGQLTDRCSFLKGLQTALPWPPSRSLLTNSVTPCRMLKIIFR
jgi:hypothetical protein